MSALDTFSAEGGEKVDPPTVLRAGIPLELSGEVVRSRICTFVDENGEEWALRPDLTLPVALDELKRRNAGESGETCRYYAGPVFRLPVRSGDPIEFEQVGIEYFGVERSGEADARLFATVCKACLSEGVESGQAILGDLAIFPAFVDALDVPEAMKTGLKRAFRQEGGIKAYLDADRNGAAAGISRRMRGLSRDEIGQFVDDMSALTGIRAVGERTQDEIVDRLVELSANDPETMLADTQRGLLQALLDLDVPLETAGSSLRKFADEAGLTLAMPAVEALEGRISEIAATAPADFLEGARFQTRFGRRFTYYDGFVFELRGSRDANAPSFAAGGRYDSLLRGLSRGSVDLPALGGVVMPHRFGRSAGDDR